MAITQNFTKNGMVGIPLQAVVGGTLTITIPITAICPNCTALLEAAKVAHSALHQFHPVKERIAVGKGICDWGPCKQLREAIEQAEKEGKYRWEAGITL